MLSDFSNLFLLSNHHNVVAHCELNET
jgi:hypothetical protein